MTAIQLQQATEKTATLALGEHVECVGVDVVDIPQFARVADLAGRRFTQRLFTNDELAFCGESAKRLATTVAGKEATVKVLGSGFRDGTTWLDIEILRKLGGTPYVCLSGAARERAHVLGLRRIAISLSHELTFAVAVAFGIRSGENNV